MSHRIGYRTINVVLRMWRDRARLMASWAGRGAGGAMTLTPFAPRARFLCRDRLPADCTSSTDAVLILPVWWGCLQVPTSFTASLCITILKLLLLRYIP
jgi:hypothetical protein